MRDKTGELMMRDKIIRHLSEEHRRKLSVAHKGKHHTEETRLKIGLAGKGRYLSDETKQKISNTLNGHIVSLETRLKISQNLKGRKAWNEGKHIRCNTGRTHFKKGMKHTEEWKKKMRDRMTGKNNPCYGKRFSKEFYKRIGKLGLKQNAYGVSKPELKLREILKENNIEFISQKEYELGFADIFIEPNIMIFVDGKYWHNYPHGTQKDAIQTKWLENHGFRVIRFWANNESEIKQQQTTILNLIRSVIRNS